GGGDGASGTPASEISDTNAAAASTAGDGPGEASGEASIEASIKGGGGDAYPGGSTRGPPSLLRHCATIATAPTTSTAAVIRPTTRRRPSGHAVNVRIRPLA